MSGRASDWLIGCVCVCALTLDLLFSATHLAPHALPASATPFTSFTFLAMAFHAGEPTTPFLVCWVDGIAPPLLFTDASTAAMSS